VPARSEEFSDLYLAEYAGVASYCWRLLRDRDLADETAQEAFTRLFAKWVRVRQPRHYVYRIATNLIRDSWNSRQRQEDAAEAARCAADTPTPVTDLAAALAVRDAVQALSARLRPVVLLHYYADLPIAEIAIALDRPAGSIKRQLAEARALLASELDEESTRA
jgi:RNA polymerase sigma-70 factor (ECF subfamily)